MVKLPLDTLFSAPRQVLIFPLLLQAPSGIIEPNLSNRNTMAKLIFEHSGEEEELPDDSPIAEVCEKAGLPFACTEGVCGTCFFKVISGQENLSKPTKEEEDFVGENNYDERLACQCRIKGGVVKISF
jgi:ferredoxin